MIIGSVNGGVWQTFNADPTNPAAITWTAVTDQFGSLAIGDVAFNPLNSNVVFAGTGLFSNGFEGGPPIGMLRSLDGGNTWQLVGPETGGRRIKNIVVTGDFDPTPGVQQAILAGTINGDGINGSRNYQVQGGALFRSTNNGTNFTQIAIAPGSTGAITGLVADPNNAARYFASIPGTSGGVFRSDDGGQTWNAFNNGITNINGSSVIELTVQNQGGTTVIFAAVATGNTVNGVFRSNDGGQNWTPLAAPPAGLNAGASFAEKINLVADPANNDVIYISGQSTNNIFRYNPAGPGSWVQIVGPGFAGGGTAPHADARELVFLNNNTLLESDDGGFYFMQNPTNAVANNWQSFVGNMGVIEFYSTAYDNLNNRFFGGTQDNGTSVQVNPGSLDWNRFLGGDGQNAEAAYSGGNVTRYSMSNNLSGFRRQTFDNANNPVTAFTQVLLASAATPAVALSGLNATDAGFTGFFFFPYDINAVNPNRLLLGSQLTGGGLYESTNQGDIITNIAPAGMGSVLSVVSGSLNNADAAYFSDTNGDIWVRTVGGGAFTRTNFASFAGTDTALDLVVDPNDWQIVYAVDQDGVFRSTNGGNSWQDLTNNLSIFSTTSNTPLLLRSIDLVDNSAATGDGTLIVGGLGGVYRLRPPFGSAGAPVWSELGLGLPNAIVKDLRFDATDNVIVAGTYGRGAWTISNATNAVLQQGTLVINGDMDFPNQDDTIRLVRNATFNTMLDVIVNGTNFGPFSLADIANIQVNGLGGSDRLIIDHSRGAIQKNVAYNGGTGLSDSLETTGNPGFTFARSSYRVGATQDAGILIEDPDGNMGPGGFGPANGDELIVNFTGLEPIVTDTPVGVFDVVLSINDDFGAVQNSGQLNGANALQLTDINGTFETTRWANKTSVIISGSQGADTVVFDYTVASAGLASLNNFGNAGPGIPIIDDQFGDVFVALRSANGILHFNDGNLGLDRSWFGVTPASGFNTGNGFLAGVQGLYTITDEDALAEYLVDDTATPAGRNYQFLDSAGDNRLTSASLPNLNVLFDGGSYFSFQMAMGAFVDNITITANNAGFPPNLPTNLSFFGNAGNDTFTVTPSTSAIINIDGGPPVFGDPGVPPGDRLIITTPGSTVTPLGSPDGVVTTPGRFPVNFVSIETVIVPDRFEINNIPALATFLGSDPFVTLRDLSIHSVDDPLTPLVNEADVDFFRYTAHDTGYLVIHGQYVSSIGGQIVVEVFRRPQDALDPLAFNNPLNYLTSVPAVPGSIDGTRLVIPVVAQTVYYIRVRGANQLVDVNNYSLELENFKAPIPTVVDMLATSDSGRFNNDNITNDTTPTFNIQADLQFLASQGIPILTAAQAAAGTTFGAAVEVTININGSGTLVTGFANVIAASGNTIFSFTPTVPLPDGQHQITAAVRMFDPRLPTPVNGREQLGSPPLSFIIDTVAPIAPTLNLVNDTGVNGDAPTFNDRVTRDPLSPFSGVAENGSLVRLGANGIFMGDNYANLTGQWYVQPQFSLNNPAFFPYDGLRFMSASAEDLAGNVSGLTLLEVAIDTQGPNVIDLFAIDANGNVVPVDLLDPAKPSLQPTAQVAGLKIVFEDFPLRIASFLPGWDAINELVGSDPVNYVVRGVKNGVIPIASVLVTNFNFAGLPGFAEVDLTFFAPLKDDVYTLEISPRVTDDAGNPVPNVPGGIVLQFTVDSQPELGIYAGGTINIDLNGNFVDDGLSGDIKFKYNPPGSQVFVGQFTDEFGAADGWDRLGVYGRLGNRKLGVQLDFDNDGVFDYTKTLTLQINGTAIAGNFSDFKDGDEIGIFTGKKWYLDTNGNNDIDPGDTVLNGNMRGLPIVGDFDGDGFDDLATFQNNKFYFDLADDGLDGNTDRVMNFGLPTRLDRPVAADWDLDGITDVGLWTPGRATTIGAAKAEWFWVVSDGTPIPDRDPQNDFRVEPFGRDFVATFGNPKAMPIVGNFDPPLVPSQNQAAQAAAFGGPGFDGSTLAALGAEAYFTQLYQQRHGNG